MVVTSLKGTSIFTSFAARAAATMWALTTSGTDMRHNGSQVERHAKKAETARHVRYVVAGNTMAGQRRAEVAAPADEMHLVPVARLLAGEIDRHGDVAVGRVTMIEVVNDLHVNPFADIATIDSSSRAAGVAAAIGGRAASGSGSVQNGADHSGTGTRQDFQGALDIIRGGAAVLNHDCYAVELRRRGHGNRRPTRAPGGRRSYHPASAMRR